LFPEVSKQAHILAGIKVKPTNSESSSSRSDSDSSGRDLDSDYEGLGNEDHQNNGDGNGWTRNGMDAGNQQDSSDDEVGGQQVGDNDGQQSDNEDGDGQQEVEGSGVDASGYHGDDNYSQDEEGGEEPVAGDEEGGQEPVAGDDDYEVSEVQSEASERGGRAVELKPEEPSELDGSESDLTIGSSEREE
jgi:hypothetical protein